MGYLTLTNPITLPSSWTVDYGSKEIFVSESGTKKAYFNGQLGGYSHLTFDGNLNDESGKVWTAYGTIGYTTGKLGQCINFTGSQYLSVDITIGAKDFTLQFYGKSTSSSSEQGYVGTSGNSYALGLRTNRGRWWLSDGTVFIDNVQLADGNWNHYCLCRKNDVFYAFRNGVLIGTYPYIIDYGTRTFLIGCCHTAGSYLLNGQIDDFRFDIGKALYTSNFTPPTRSRNLCTSPMQEIYTPGNAPDYILIQSSAISATEALTRARTGRPKDMNNVLLYLRPNEVTSDYKVLDLSGNGNNAQLTGGNMRKVMK